MLSSSSHFALMPYSNWVNPESPAGELRADGKKVLTLNSSIRYCALRPAPQLQYTGKLWLVRELLRYARVPRKYPRLSYLRALLSARVPLIDRQKPCKFLQSSKENR